MLVKPIPDDATIGDPIWHSQILELANALVREGAKARLVERFTGLPHKKVANLYQIILNQSPVSGPITQGTAGFFATPKTYGASWNLQSAIFLSCYLRLEKLIGMVPNRGWLLLKAFQAYKAMTQPLLDTTGIKRLDINQAYSLLALTGFGRMRGREDIQQAHCMDCGVNFLVVAQEELDTQRCPICAMNENYSRLAEQSSSKRRLAAAGLIP